MNITNLPLENDEFLLYVSDEYMELNEESVDIYLTNKNIFYGKDEKVSLFNKEYKYYKIGLGDVLIVNKNYKIYTREDADGYLCVCLLVNSINRELSFRNSEDDENGTRIKAFIIILINILNFVYKH